MAIIRIVQTIDADETMVIVRSLRSMGLVQGKDFDFRYCPTKYDPVSGHLEKEKHSVFTFYEDKWATWFSLRWS
jgi:hypothetical protein